MQTATFHICGDSEVGKTNLLYSYKHRAPPSEYRPTPTDSLCLVNLEIDGHRIELSVWDKSGNNKANGGQQLPHLCIICFSLADPVSLQSVRDKWQGRARRRNRDMPILLVGTKLDLREAAKQQQQHAEVPGFINRQQGQAMANIIGARAYIECSAQNEHHVDDVFREAVRIICPRFCTLNSRKNGGMPVFEKFSHKKKHKSRHHKDKDCQTYWRADRVYVGMIAQHPGPQAAEYEGISIPIDGIILEEEEEDAGIDKPRGSEFMRRYVAEPQDPGNDPRKRPLPVPPVHCRSSSKYQQSAIQLAIKQGISATATQQTDGLSLRHEVKDTPFKDDGHYESVGAAQSTESTLDGTSKGLEDSLNASAQTSSTQRQDSPYDYYNPHTTVQSTEWTFSLVTSQGELTSHKTEPVNNASSTNADQTVRVGSKEAARNEAVKSKDAAVVKHLGCSAGINEHLEEDALSATAETSNKEEQQDNPKDFCPCSHLDRTLQEKVTLRCKAPVPSLTSVATSPVPNRRRSLLQLSTRADPRTKAEVAWLNEFRVESSYVKAPTPRRRSVANYPVPRVRNSLLQLSAGTELRTEVAVQNFFLRTPSEDDPYKVTSPQGLGLIININKYERNNFGHADRLGSDKDVKRVKEMLEKLDFEVMVKENLTCVDMAELFSKVAICDTMADHGCFVCFIMAHGAEGVIYGSDWEALKIESIIDKFRANQCKYLRHKPKIFFIQACRGRKIDSVRQQVVDRQESVAQMQPVYSPIDSDFLISYANTEGYEAFRDEEKGSPYLQTLCDVIEEKHKDDHVLKMLTTVNNRLKSIPVRIGCSDHYAVSQVVTQLSRDCFLNPDLADK